MNYIVDIPEEEIALMLGFYGERDSGYLSATAGSRERSGYNGAGQLRPGATIQAKRLSEFQRRFTEREAETLKAANTLRALADLITTALPSALVPPEPKEEPTA